jgi:glycosyltransferase involved in cell wall biosynthesis
MNVGLVVPGFSADAADWCIPALRHLARALTEHADVRVLAVRYPYHVDRYDLEGSEVITLGGAAIHGPATLALWRRTLGVLRAEHRRRPFDVLHAFWATESGMLTALAGRLLHIPTLVSLAGGELVALSDINYGDQRVAWERLKVAVALRLAGAVSAGSRYLQQIALRYRADVALLPLGVDTALFRPAAPNAGHRLLHVGTLTPVKDQRTLLAAFAMLREHDARVGLDVVGDGSLRAHLEELAGRLGLSSHVRFVGDVDHCALVPLYQAADAFVVSSRHEAQCMVALEAASCGLRVVGTSVGVVPELAPELPVPVGDVSALARAIASSGRAVDVRALVERDFALDVCTRGFLSCYGRLAA